MKTALYKVGIAYALLHNSREVPIAKAFVRVNEDTQLVSVSLRFDLETASRVLPGHENTLKRWAKADAVSAVMSFRKDSRYPIIWSEDSCLQCVVKELS